MHHADQQPLARGITFDATMRPPAFSRASLAHHTLSPLISVRCHEISLLKLPVSTSRRTPVVYMGPLIAYLRANPDYQGASRIGQMGAQKY